MNISVRKTAKKTVAIIGDGCAGWSLAARVDRLSADHIELFKKRIIISLIAGASGKCLGFQRLCQSAEKNGISGKSSPVTVA